MERDAAVPVREVLAAENGIEADADKFEHGVYTLPETEEEHMEMDEPVVPHIPNSAVDSVDADGDNAPSGQDKSQLSHNTAKLQNFMDQAEYERAINKKYHNAHYLAAKGLTPERAGTGPVHDARSKVLTTSGGEKFVSNMTKSAPPPERGYNYTPPLINNVAQQNHHAMKQQQRSGMPEINLNVVPNANMPPSYQMNLDDTQVSGVDSQQQTLTRQNEISTYLNFTQANILAQQGQTQEGEASGSASSISAAEFPKDDSAHLSKVMSASSSIDDLHRSQFPLPPNRSYLDHSKDSAAKYSVGTPTPLPGMDATGQPNHQGTLSNPNSQTKMHLTYSANSAGAYSLDDSVGDYIIYDTQIREEYV